ncbi:hypothetical protein GW17_00042609 [Ensete ventricosum]|nr:hypothetical protein GW17_00042609 [Ensete ventricosum]
MGGHCFSLHGEKKSPVGDELHERRDWESNDQFTRPLNCQGSGLSKVPPIPIRGGSKPSCNKTSSLQQVGGQPKVDATGKGTLDYGEFVAVSIHLQRMANDEHLRRAFSYFDKDGNGYIEPEELQEALSEDGAADSIDVANDILQEVDTDKDGRISYDEFVAMMKTGTDWRKASRHYSRGRFNSLSIRLMKDGSVNLGNE